MVAVELCRGSAWIALGARHLVIEDDQVEAGIDGHALRQRQAVGDDITEHLLGQRESERALLQSHPLPRWCAASMPGLTKQITQAAGRERESRDSKRTHPRECEGHPVGAPCERVVLRHKYPHGRRERL